LTGAARDAISPSPFPTLGRSKAATKPPRTVRRAGAGRAGAG